MRALSVALCLLLSLVPTPPLAAQAADTVREARVEPLFTGRDALFAGGFVVGTLALAPLDVRLAEAVQDSLLQRNLWLRDTAGALELLGFPGSVLVGGGLYLAGWLTDRPRLADLGLHTGESIVVAELITFPLKSLAGRARPRVDVTRPHDYALGRGVRGDDFQSFPSGHTSAAFATAAAVTTELAEWWPERKLAIGTALFTGATLVGVSRMYHNKHWASDVMAGAAIGSFSGWKVVRYHHTHPGNRLDRWLLPTTVLPDGRGGLSLTWRVR